MHCKLRHRPIFCRAHLANKPMKISEYYANKTEELLKAGIEHPALNVEVLISFYFQWDRTYFYLNQQQLLSSAEQADLDQLLARRLTREPLQYITGRQNFYGRDFITRPGNLIPRPETELLVTGVLEAADKIWLDQPLTVVDIGTGTGVITITLAVERLDWQVKAVDISPLAIKLARENSLQLGAKIELFEGDLFQPFLTSGDKFDIIVSNPPYIPRSDLLTLEDEVRLHEPLLALDGGETGLDYYRRIINEGLVFLNRPGLIALEIGFGQEKEITKLIENSGAKSKQILHDLQQIPRIILAEYR